MCIRDRSATCKVTVVKQTPSVNYSTHVQDIGWQGYVKDGSTAGTVSYTHLDVYKRQR